MVFSLASLEAGQIILGTIALDRAGHHLLSIDTFRRQQAIQESRNEGAAT